MRPCLRVGELRRIPGGCGGRVLLSTMMGHRQGQGRSGTSCLTWHCLHACTGRLPTMRACRPSHPTFMERFSPGRRMPPNGPPGPPGGPPPGCLVKMRSSWMMPPGPKSRRPLGPPGPPPGPPPAPPPSSSAASISTVLSSRWPGGRQAGQAGRQCNAVQQLGRACACVCVWGGLQPGGGGVGGGVSRIGMQATR